MAGSSQILPGQSHEDQNKTIKTLKHRCKVQVHYSTSECRNRVLRLTHVVSRHLLLPDLLVRSLSLYCQVNLCKGAGNFQSIIPHIRSFLCSIVKFWSFLHKLRVVSVVGSLPAWRLARLGFSNSEGSMDRVGRWLKNWKRAILMWYFVSRLKSSLHWMFILWSCLEGASLTEVRV
jgi:hypothetical protein